MKKQLKKLKLAKETVRNLDITKAGHFIAGNTTTNCCPYTADHTCECGVSGGQETCFCNSNQVACIEHQTQNC